MICRDYEDFLIAFSLLFGSRFATSIVSASRVVDPGIYCMACVVFLVELRMGMVLMENAKLHAHLIYSSQSS